MSQTVDFLNLQLVIAIKCNLRQFRKICQYCNEFHNYYTRQSQSLHTAVGRNEAIYNTFTFHGIRIWNYISTKNSVDVSYASFKHSLKLFIQNNSIPDRISY